MKGFSHIGLASQPVRFDKHILRINSPRVTQDPKEGVQCFSQLFASGFVTKSFSHKEPASQHIRFDKHIVKMKTPRVAQGPKERAQCFSQLLASGFVMKGFSHKNQYFNIYEWLSTLSKFIVPKSHKVQKKERSVSHNCLPLGLL